MAMTSTSGSTRLLAGFVLAALLAAGLYVAQALNNGGEASLAEMSSLPEENQAQELSPGTDPAILVEAMGPAPGEREQVPAAVAGAARGLVEDSAEAPGRATDEILGVAGIVKVLEGDPVDSADLNGELGVTVWNEDTGKGGRVKVQGGAFRIAYRPDKDGELVSVDGEYTLDADTSGMIIELDEPDLPFLGGVLLVDKDGSALGRGGSAEFPFGTEDAVIFVTRPRTTRLTVVDKQSGAAVSGVKVVGLRGWENEGARHPKGLRAVSLTAETVSPVTLNPPVGLLSDPSVNALVSGEGYAWAPVTLDFPSGADRTVELERGATLTVTIDGEVPAAGRLRLYQDGISTPASEVPVRGLDPIVYEGLVPGEYSVRLELGEWFQRPTKLAAQEVLLQAGGQAGVTLSVAPVVAAAKAKASGVLVIPAAWELESHYATVELLAVSSDGSEQHQTLRANEFKALPAETGAYSFALPPMEVGQYAFELKPMDWKQIYDLPPEGRTDLRFELPEPVEITVKVIDASTGDPVDVTSVSWHPEWPREAMGGRHMTQPDSKAPGLFRFQVTRGPIEISCWFDGYNHALKSISTDLATEVTLELSRASRAVFILRDGEDEVPWPDSKRRRIESVETGERVYGSSGYKEGHPWAGLKEPGRYRLIIPEFNGYEPMEPVEFELLAGQEIEVVIDLIRR